MAASIIKHLVRQDLVEHVNDNGEIYASGVSTGPAARPAACGSRPNRSGFLLTATIHADRVTCKRCLKKLADQATPPAHEAVKQHGTALQTLAQSVAAANLTTLERKSEGRYTHTYTGDFVVRAQGGEPPTLLVQITHGNGDGWTLTEWYDERGFSAETLAEVFGLD